MNSQVYQEYRCSCGKLLFKGILISSEVETKCLRCGKINVFNSLPQYDAKSYTLIFKKDGTIVNASPSVEDVLGYKPDELIGKSVADINPNVKKDFFAQTLTNISKTSSNYRFDPVHLNKRKRKIYLTSVVKFNPDKNGGTFSAHYKVKKLQKVGRSVLPENAQKLCDVITEFDLNRICTYVSPEVKKITGYDPAELIGKSMFSIIPKKIQTLAKIHLKLFVPKEMPFRVNRNQAVAKDGHIINYESYFLPRYNDLGEFTGYTTLNWLKRPKNRQPKAN